MTDLTDLLQAYVDGWNSYTEREWYEENPYNKYPDGHLDVACVHAFFAGQYGAEHQGDARRFLKIRSLKVDTLEPEKYYGTCHFCDQPATSRIVANFEPFVVCGECQSNRRWGN